MWPVQTTDLFDAWFDTLTEGAQEKVLAALLVLQRTGPVTGRPLVDAVKGSCYNNMKELRIQYRGSPIRIFFAFDPYRRAVILCAGTKAGHEKSFYEKMIRLADTEFKRHLSNAP